jgi:hypothetical protein
MEIIKMDPELKFNWTTALRGGNYLQAEGVLYDGKSYDDKPDEGKPRMCCLGVLEHVCGNEIDVFRGEDAVTEIQHMPDDLKDVRKSPVDVLKQPWSDKRWDGDEGMFTANLEGYLAHMNDYGKSFEEIADYIEKHI